MFTLTIVRDGVTTVQQFQIYTQAYNAYIAAKVQWMDRRTSLMALTGPDGVGIKMCGERPRFNV